MGAVTIMQKIMRRYILYILLGTLVCTYAHAQSFCHLVQDVGTYYEDTIESAGTYYYSAWTYDLPMDVYITSIDASCSEPPQVWADLTCDPGVYDDPNIRDLVNDTSLTNKYGITVPFSLGCETNFVDGHYVHHLKLGKSYRNKLQLIGVDYNVRAYVKVVVPCAGTAHLEQDTSSQACVKDARLLALTDSTHILANDSLNTYLFPIKDWLAQADSVALYWEGTAPVHIWLNANDCEFEIDTQHSIDNFIIPANGEEHLSKDLLNWYTTEVQDSTGFLFVKVFSPEDGRLFSRPLVPETKGATLLHYDSIQQVTSNDNAFFCFPISWESVEWIANTRKKVKLFLHTSPETAPIDSFAFDLEDNARRVLIWSKPEMALLKPQAIGQLLFVRFQCSTDFTFTPVSLSELSPCVNKAIRLRPGVSSLCSKNHIYGFYYSDWEGYPMTIQWEATDVNDLQNLFIADTCEFQLRWSQTSTKKRCVYYFQTVRGGQTWTIDSATIAGWKDRVTPEGYFYVRMTGGGYITFTTNKPEEEEPEDIDPGPTTGIYEQEETLPCKKVLHNGQIYIMRAGKAYSITGQALKIE